VVDAARAWARSLRAAHPEILRIGYFGSYARGDYVPGSDLDVLVEVSGLGKGQPQHAHSAVERGLAYYPATFPVGLDVFVYTAAELARLRAAGAGFIRTIEDEFKSLG
jgi:hypothetical protein